MGFPGAATGQRADIFGLENIQPLNPCQERNSQLGQQMKFALILLDYS